MERKNIKEYDVTRAVALILVLLGHCTYTTITTDCGGFDLGLSESTSMVHNRLCSLITIFYKFHMPLFVALSGCLWAVHLQKKGLPQFKSLLKAKFSRLIIPFLITAAFWTAPIYYFTGYLGGENVSLSLLSQ